MWPAKMYPASTKSDVKETSTKPATLNKIRCLEPATHLVTGFMEKLFFRLGYTIGCHPWWTILISLVMCAVLGSGLAFWRQEHDMIALWTTADSKVRYDSRWVNQHFTDDWRYETVILTCDNVLRPDVLLFLADLDQRVKSIRTSSEHDWDYVCARFGSSLKSHLRRRRELHHLNGRSLLNNSETIVEAEDDDGDKLNLSQNRTKYETEVLNDDPPDNNFDFDLSQLDFTGVFAEDDEHSDESFLGLSGQQLLDLLSTPDRCIYRNILEVWDIDMQRISQLDQQQLLSDINAAIDKETNAESITSLLSDIRRDEKGSVIGAGATLLTWLLDNTQDNTSIHKEWELHFIQETLYSNATLPPGVEIFALSKRSYHDAIAETLASDLTLLMAGFSLMILYISFFLGRFNLVEQRLLLAIVGAAIVGLAILASYGLCFYLGVLYGPVHPILPFLLLGIGVDDMFVIIQALDNLNDEERKRPIPERIALAMKHAGASVTVTSVTDVVAFGIGSTASMPSLSAFCVNATAGISILFLLVITFFVAVTALDERRRASRRDGCCFILQKSTWKPSECSQRELLKIFFDKWFGPFLLKTPVKFAVILITVAAVGANLWAIFQLEQNFDPNWYLRKRSYVSHYYASLTEHFPENGERAALYTGRIDYIEQRDELNRMIRGLRTNPYVETSSITYWYEDFQIWLNETKKVEFPSEEKQFKSLVQEYLFSPSGRYYLQDVKVEGSLLDSQSNFTLIASRARFNHHYLLNSTVKNLALDSIKALSEEIYFGPQADPSSPVIFAPVYVIWEANKLISSELVRNLCLTMIAVVAVTVVLIFDLAIVFWVFTCIAFTLIDVLGLLYFFGLSIEIVSSIVIILSAGLAVDYAAHIGHTFTTLRGSRSNRAKVSLSLMGPAVWNGGLSTFLAFILLANSDSYVFTTFFKLFFSVVAFGLFHGLAYLPVVLSWFGPSEEQLQESEPVHSTEFSSTAIAKPQLPLDNPSFVLDVQSLKKCIKMEGWKGPGRYQEASLGNAPFIPQPDYTPIVKRRENFQYPRARLADVDANEESVTGPPLKSKLTEKTTNTSSDNVEESDAQGSYVSSERLSSTNTSSVQGRRVWYHPQWNSSQFHAHDWSAELMKRLSVEAKRQYDYRIRKEADLELDHFETEMDLYLQKESEEQETTAAQSSASSLSTPNASADRQASPSSTPDVEDERNLAKTMNGKEDTRARDRDQESLESGYMSSYAGEVRQNIPY